MNSTKSHCSKMTSSDLKTTRTMEKMTKNRIAEAQDNRFNSSEITIAQLNSVINWTFAALWPLTKLR